MREIERERERETQIGDNPNNKPTFLIGQINSNITLERNDPALPCRM